MDNGEFVDLLALVTDMQIGKMVDNVIEIVQEAHWCFMVILQLIGVFKLLIVLQIIMEIMIQEHV